MNGEEFAARRKSLGYTQGQLAEVLKLSPATMSRLEERAEVPGEHVQVLLSLPPAARTGRGPYKAEKPATSRKVPPPPQPRRAPVPNLERRQEEPARPAAQLSEVVHEADAIGAVEVGAVWLAACLLLGIYRHIEQRAVEGELEAAFARIHVRSPVPRKVQPPPLPKRGRVRCCWRCGTWL